MIDLVTRLEPFGTEVGEPGQRTAGADSVIEGGASVALSRSAAFAALSRSFPFRKGGVLGVSNAPPTPFLTCAECSVGTCSKFPDRAGSRTEFYNKPAEAVPSMRWAVVAAASASAAPSRWP